MLSFAVRRRRRQRSHRARLAGRRNAAAHPDPAAQDRDRDPRRAARRLQPFAKLRGRVVPLDAQALLADLATLFVSAAISTQALIAFPERTLFVVAGTAIIVLPLVTYFYPALRIGPSLERWLGPCVGMIGGFLGGVSAFYGPPLMIFLAALRLPKAEFVPAISLMFFVGAFGLTVGLLGFGVTGTRELGLSALATLPVFVGMSLGRRVRIALNERQFALLLLAIYVVIGTTFLLKGLA